MSHPSPSVTAAGLTISAALATFVRDEVLPGLDLSPEHVWQGLADIVAELAPRNAELLAIRERLQTRIDAWHREHDYTPERYLRFLREIGYLEPEGPPFEITTSQVDPEIATLAGPQLVVPVDNARYALNAANARWGSLYDAVYGSDLLRSEAPAEAETPPAGAVQDGTGLDVARARRVVAWVNRFLDEALPLRTGSFHDLRGCRVCAEGLIVRLSGEEETGLADPAAFVGYTGDPEDPERILLRHHGLHIELRFDPQSPVGALSAAGLSDVQLEAALTVIQDLEDSVAAVDAADKVRCYRHWLGLMRGDLSATFQTQGQTRTRTLQPDRSYRSAQGEAIDILPGRALMLVRNVGHLMTTDAVTDRAGEPVPEGILDAFITVLIALHDLRGLGRHRNSRTGSVYIVKPKMHSPAEVRLACDLFARVEQAFGLAPHTVKIGLMDEERRFSANLGECLRAARERVVFINTGFLDRTGDEIHTAMQAGPVLPKGAMKQARWIQAYEQRNVRIGLNCGLAGRAQIGKGMWAMPDAMAAMLREKIAHPEAGASCAWVPSPTAAVLHAMHYHRVDVRAVQQRLAGEPPAPLEDLLALPLADPAEWTAEAIQAELDNNCQGILGYVVRWVDQGIGCSKVPDIHDNGLMEDRATLRISSQHIANWLHHGVVSEAQVRATLARMAARVDAQNADDPAYQPLAPALDGSAFAAASALIFAGATQPSGYTEPLLHRLRRRCKTQEDTSTAVPDPVDATPEASTAHPRRSVQHPLGV